MALEEVGTPVCQRSSETSNADSSSFSSSFSSSDSVARKLQPPSLKKVCGSWIMVFMMVAQFRLVFDAVECFNRDGVNVCWSAHKVFENDDHVEVFQAKLDTLEMHDLDIGECDHHERRLGELRKAVGRRLNHDRPAIRHTVEAKIAEWHVDRDAFAFASIAILSAEFLNSLSSCARLRFSSCSASNSSSPCSMWGCGLVPAVNLCSVLRVYPISDRCIAASGQYHTTYEAVFQLLKDLEIEDGE